MADLNDQSTDTSLHDEDTDVHANVETDGSGKGRLLVSAISDEDSNDSFGRLRVSNLQTLFDSQFEYGKNDRFWDETVTGAGASSTHLPDESSIRLRVGTVSGEIVQRRTRRYYRYQPGKSQNIILTGVLGAGKANVRKRIGYFDDDNGVFFEQDGTTLYIVRRTNVTGTPVDNRVAQSSWNRDTLDGTGGSGVTLDTSKANIYNIDLQWLGAGRIRYSVNIDGASIFAHEIDNANALTEVYMTTANLPITYEIENTGTAASQTDLIQICSTVQSEGGQSEFDLAGRIFSQFNLTEHTINATGYVPVVSIRLKTTFNSITNRGTVFPILIEALSSTTTAVAFTLNPASITGASWTSTDADSIVEYDVSATAYTGGTVLSYRFVPSGGNSQTTAGELPLFRDPLTNDVAGTDPDVLMIAMRSLSGTGQARASITWSEVY
jgi:hypothetical protein